MEQKIKDFYESHNIPVSKMIFIGKAKRNLSEGSVKEAATAVYEDIEKGTITIPPIRIAWEVYARAKKIKTDSDAKESKASDRKIKELTAKLEYATLPWWEKARRKVKSAYKS